MKQDKKELQTMQGLSVLTHQNLGPVNFVIATQEMVKIREYSPTDLKKSITALVIKAKELEGITTEIMPAIADDIVNYIKDVCRNLSLDELDKALTMNRTGEVSPRINHYNKMNVPFLSQVVEKYRHWKRDIRTRNNIELSNGSKQVLIPSITESEKKILIKTGVEKCYNSFITSGIIPIGYNYVYDVLIDTGVLSSDIYKTYIDIAKSRLMRKYTTKNANSYADRLGIKTKIAAIKNGDMSLVNIEAKKAAMEVFFISVRDSNKSLFEVLGW